MLKQLLLSLMLLCVSATAAASVFDVKLDAAPYSRDKAREQAVKVLLSRLGGSAAAGSWVAEEILNDWTRYTHGSSVAGSYTVQFAEAELSPLLNSAGLSLWRGERPALLVWLVSNGRAKEMPGIGWVRASHRYAMPLLWPLWDLQEHMQIDKTKLHHLAEASQRYGAGVWLAVQQQGNQFDWRLYHKDSEQPLAQGQSASVAALFASINDYWIARQAAMPETRPDNSAPAQALQAGADAPGELTIVVTGLTQFADMVRLEQRLGRLENVARVQVLDSAGDQARFRLELDSAAARPALSRAGLSALGDRRYRLERTQ